MICATYPSTLRSQSNFNLSLKRNFINIQSIPWSYLAHTPNLLMRQAPQRNGICSTLSYAFSIFVLMLELVEISITTRRFLTWCHNSGRGIWTPDLLNPNQARYQTTLYPKIFIFKRRFGVKNRSRTCIYKTFNLYRLTFWLSLQFLLYISFYLTYILYNNFFKKSIEDDYTISFCSS